MYLHETGSHHRSLVKRLLTSVPLLIIAAACALSCSETTNKSDIGEEKTQRTQTQALEAPGLFPEARLPRHSDARSPRFTVAILPDTQYLLDDDRSSPEPVAAAFRYLRMRDAAGREDRNIRFMAQLGDVTEHGTVQEMALANELFSQLDGKMPYSVLAGNHDVRGNDQRGPSPFLDTFGPQRFSQDPTFMGASPDGYNRYHVFVGGGRRWLVLALDWRLSDAGFAWAQQVIDENPTLPVILTTHDLARASESGEASLSGYGQQLWDRLIRTNDQIFLTLNGHYWPPGSTVLQNDAGHEVYVHITNYQDRYFGGSGMMRLYEFDLARKQLDVETLSPWILAKPARQRNALEQQEIELSDTANRFSLSIDFEERFADFDPPEQRPERRARALSIPETVGYWRFDGGTAGAPVPAGTVIRDATRHGNDLTVMEIDPDGPSTISWTDDHHPDQPAHGSIFIDGGQRPTPHGAYLLADEDAPINGMQFEDGYTVEAFMKIPTAFNEGGHNWMGLLSWTGRSGDAGKTGGDPEEPIGSLNVSPERFLQWISYPVDRVDSSTSWSHGVPTETWTHVAVVNDGELTVVYVQGSPIARNPNSPAIGISTTGTPFVIGGTQYANIFDQSFFGTLGDIRIVARPLQKHEFMTAKFRRFRR